MKKDQSINIIAADLDRIPAFLYLFANVHYYTFDVLRNREIKLGEGLSILLNLSDLTEGDLSWLDQIPFKQLIYTEKLPNNKKICDELTKIQARDMANSSIKRAFEIFK